MRPTDAHLVTDRRGHGGGTAFRIAREPAVEQRAGGALPDSNERRRSCEKHHFRMT